MKPATTSKAESRHLGELLLQARLRGRKDAFRTKRGFSQDIEATQAVLFNKRYSKRIKVRECANTATGWKPTSPVSSAKSPQKTRTCSSVSSKRMKFCGCVMA